jgi:hypothetical protein
MGVCWSSETDDGVSRDALKPYYTARIAIGVVPTTRITTVYVIPTYRTHNSRCVMRTLAKRRAIKSNRELRPSTGCAYNILYI